MQGLWPRAGGDVEETLRGPREEVERLKGERVYLDQSAKEGSERARELSGMTLKIVGQRVGLGY